MRTARAAQRNYQNGDLIQVLSSLRYDTIHLKHKVHYQIYESRKIVTYCGTLGSTEKNARDDEGRSRSCDGSDSHGD